MRLGELLLHDDAIRPAELEAALAEHRRRGGLLGEHLVRQQAITEPLLHYYLGEQRRLRLAEERDFSRLGPIAQLWREFFALSPRSTLASIALLLLGTALALTFPLVVKLVFDYQIYAERIGTILLVAGLVVGLQLTSHLASFGAGRLFLRANYRFSSDVRDRLYRVLNHLHVTTLASRGSGDWLSRLTTDVDNVVDRWEALFIGFWKNLFAITFSCIVLSLVDPWLTAGVVGVSVLTVGVAGRVSNLANGYLARRPVMIAGILGLLTEMLGGFRALKSHNAQRRALGEFQARFDEYYRNDFRMVRCWNIAANLRVVLGILLSSLVLLVGGHYVIAGRYSIGDLMLVILTVNMLAPYVDELMQVIIKVNDVKRYWLRCRETLDLNVDPARLERRSADAPRLGGEVKLEEVTFSYGARTVLRNLSVTLAPRRCYAVIGRSGSGKSTLLKLLLKELEPDSGRISIGGRPLNGLSEFAVCANVSYVAQRPVIFQDTVEGNIRCGGEAYLSELPQQRIEEAAQGAGAHLWIPALPQGYQTPIGDGGHPLSGGEKQRISIARSLLKSPAVCLLDEPTSALDAQNEALLIDTVVALSQRCTVIVVTHNPAFIARADQVLVLDGERTRFVEPAALDTDELARILDGGAETAGAPIRVAG